MPQLRDGSHVDDPRLDRLQQFDDRSRDYPIRQLVGAKQPRSYTWRCDTWLDQGREGACVGHAWAHEIAARPAIRPATSELAFAIYREAQRIDPWPGEQYEGTSVLAGAQITQQRGYFDEYRWCFGIDDLVLAVGYAGPVVLGINWHEGMFRPDADGYIAPTGSVMGGHAILATAVSVRRGDVTLHNSWSQSWGVNGRCRIRIPDLASLLQAGGEACVPLKRRLR